MDCCMLPLHACISGSLHCFAAQYYMSAHQQTKEAVDLAAEETSIILGLVLQALVLLSCTLPPGGAPVQLASLVYSSFSRLAYGPALLTSALEGQLCLYKLTDAAVSLRP